MRCVCFDPFRGAGIPGTVYIKPQHYFKEIERIRKADWILYPEYWQVNSLVYALKKNIFPNINSYHLGHDKIEMTRALMCIVPEAVPYTEILPNTEFNREFVMDSFCFPFVAKEVRNSCGKGVYLINNEREFDRYCSKNDVLYIQEYLPVDRDMRIVYVGDEVVCAYWRIGAKGDFRNNVARGGTISFDSVPEDAVELVRRVARKLGINHAGFDVAMVDDRFYVFEFNVLFGLEGIQKSGVNMSAKIYEYLTNSSKKFSKEDRL